MIYISKKAPGYLIIKRLLPLNKQTNKKNLHFFSVNIYLLIFFLFSICLPSGKAFIPSRECLIWLFFIVYPANLSFPNSSCLLHQPPRSQSSINRWCCQYSNVIILFTPHKCVATDNSQMESNFSKHVKNHIY